MSKGMTITIDISDDMIKGIEGRLEGVKNPKAAIKTIVNNTAEMAKKLLAEKASKEYTGKIARKSAILSSSSINKASISSQIATITFHSPVHEIKDFHVSSLQISKTYYNKNGKRGGKKIKGGVLQGKSKVLEVAFVVRFKSEHIAVVSRIPGTKMKSNPKKEKLRKFLSPSYRVMIGGERVYGASSDAIGVIMHNEAEKVIEKLLGGK